MHSAALSPRLILTKTHNTPSWRYESTIGA